MKHKRKFHEDGILGFFGMIIAILAFIGFGLMGGKSSSASTSSSTPSDDSGGDSGEDASSVLAEAAAAAASAAAALVATEVEPVTCADADQSLCGEGQVISWNPGEIPCAADPCTPEECCENEADVSWDRCAEMGGTIAFRPLGGHHLEPGGQRWECRERGGCRVRDCTNCWQENCMLGGNVVDCDIEIPDGNTQELRCG